MLMAGLIVRRCGCVRADHDARCPGAALVQERARLYAGLYDGRRPPGPTVSRVKLLNQGVVDDDPVSRRFALLEVD